ncbi:E3 ubiquitin-protein ligase Kcmf1-like [Armigeres subalbatus]|uniref:E3 ubiquitin-protein ligase Kcmf1-like n=1 Tax=Armigeres subalbatus TaxID=124917 RepID=UPI002ECFE882
MSIDHPGVHCDVCECSNLIGMRFVCLVCYDYDLCGTCHDGRKFNKEHAPYHPMQALFPKSDVSESVDGINRNEIRILCCPYCGDKDFSSVDLIAHCERYHSEGGFIVRCPICLVSGKNFLRLIDETMAEHAAFMHRKCYTRADTEAQSFRDIKCAICVENIAATDDTTHLTCFHEFHTECVTRWIRSNPICPLCRSPVNELDLT